MVKYSQAAKPSMEGLSLGPITIQDVMSYDVTFNHMTQVETGQPSPPYPLQYDIIMTS